MAYRILADDRLLLRVLVNMLKNAFEASEPGSEIRLWHERNGGHHLFNVWNPGKIDDDVAPRIFQRYFTTKNNHGRGLGTYSMKLIGERYMGGEVSFVSNDEGTTFTFRLPVDSREPL